MATKALQLVMLALVTVAGCSSSSKDDWETEYAARRRAVADLPVPLPEQTPYDSDGEKRAVYREWYWFGYKQALAGVGSSYCGTDHPLVEVQTAGFHAGQRDGMAEHQKLMVTTPTTAPCQGDHCQLKLPATSP